MSEVINAELEIKLLNMGVDPNRKNFQSEEERAAVYRANQMSTLQMSVYETKKNVRAVTFKIEGGG